MKKLLFESFFCMCDIEIKINDVSDFFGMIINFC